MALTPGQGRAALPDAGVPAVREPFGDLGDACQRRGLVDLRLGGGGAAQTDVAPQGVIEKVDVLEYQGELRHQILGGEVAHVRPADAHRA